MWEGRSFFHEDRQQSFQKVYSVLHSFDIQEQYIYFQQLQKQLKEMPQIKSLENISVEHENHQKKMIKAQKEVNKQKKKPCVSLNKIADEKKNKRNHWNHFEQRRYIKFLQSQGSLLQLSLKEKKSQRVNLRMSKCVKTRNVSQCHSHHQKMLITYHSILQIIQKHLYLFQNQRQYFIRKKDQDQVEQNQYQQSNKEEEEENVIHTQNKKESLVNERKVFKGEDRLIQNFHELENLQRFVVIEPFFQDNLPIQKCLMQQTQGNEVNYRQKYEFLHQTLKERVNQEPFFEEDSYVCLFERDQSFQLPYSY